MDRNAVYGVHLFDAKAFEIIKEKLKARETLVEKNLAMAINLAAERSVSLSRDEWNAYFRISEGYIKKRLWISRRASDAKMEAVVIARTRATRADNYDYRVMPNRGGVRLRVKRGSGGGVIKNAFVIPRAKSNGKPIIIERLVKYTKGERRDFKHGGKTSGRYGKADQLRFKALYGPSVNQHFYDSRARVAPKALSEAKQQFLQAIA